MASKFDFIRTVNPLSQLSPNILEKNPNLPKKKLVDCVNNQVNNTIPMEISLIGHDHGKNLEVDIVTNTAPDEIQDGVDDETECSSSGSGSGSSSSFGCSNSENGIEENLGDMEVQSHFHDDGMLSGFDRSYDLLKPRKKKLPPHWREYVRPLMWRCKWAELQIRELQSQASKYVRELAECDKRKQCELAKFSSEEHAAKSFPYDCQNRPIKLMKRKKRRRVEDTTDLASYTACHSLLSYAETKKSVVDVAHVDDDYCHTGNNRSGSCEYDVDGEMPSLEAKEADTLRSLLREVEETQALIRQLRARLDKVVNENTETFALDNSSFRPRNRLTNCGPNSLLPNVNEEPALLGSVPITSQWLPKKSVIPKAGVSIAEEATYPDIINSVDDPKIRQKFEKIENEIRISNRPVKEEVDDPEHHQTKLLSQSPPVQEVKTEIVQHVPDRPSKMIQEPSTVKIRPKKKRKPGWPKGKPRHSKLASG